MDEEGLDEEGLDEDGLDEEGLDEDGLDEDETEGAAGLDAEPLRRFEVSFEPVAV